MMEAASFPHLGRVVEPTREDYLKEAELSERVGHWYTGFKFRRIARRLSWTPAALHQMINADQAKQPGFPLLEAGIRGSHHDHGHDHSQNKPSASLQAHSYLWGCLRVSFQMKDAT